MMKEHIHHLVLFFIFYCHFHVLKCGYLILIVDIAWKIIDVK